MPNRSDHDLAALLIEKADEDLVAFRALLENNDVSDSVLGFHAQQAAEKAVKAVLASRGVEYDRSHSIDYLIDLLEEQKIEVPFDSERAAALTGWSVEFRYERPSVAPALDRKETLALVTEIRN